MVEAWIYLALSVVIVLGAWMFKSEAQAETPATPPPERAPQEHEVKAALADLRASLERLQAVLERQHEKHTDELHDIQRQLDRIESSRRLEDVVDAIRRQQREV